MDGLYGTIKPAIIDVTKDVDLYYLYRANYASDSNNFEQLDSSCLTKSTYGTDKIDLNGLYNLSLPLDKFKNKGIYTVYIKPKEVKTTISNVGILSSDSSVRGLVIQKNSIAGKVDDDLTGYRVEYYEDGKQIDMTRLISSCNYCQKDTSVSGRYKIMSTVSDLLFCTLTPSSSDGLSSSLPSIGTNGQEIRLINTKFNPVLVEIEMVEDDAETISTLLKGDQIRDLDNGTITTYDEDHNAFMHQEYYTLKTTNGTPIYEVRVKKNEEGNIPSYKDIVE